MSTLTFSPPYHSHHDLAAQLRHYGYAVLRPSDAALWLGCHLPDLLQLGLEWNDLPADEYLKDGGSYRFRRHASFVVNDGQMECTPHRPHWQPVKYNALHGGMERWFAPMKTHVVQQQAWLQLVTRLALLSQQLFADTPTSPCFVEAHQFRIDTANGIGRPTPEGAHRDGVDLVAVFLIDRQGIKGGETRVFEATGPTGIRFTLTEPWSLLLLDDARMIHETTPIQPANEQAGGTRDTLVITCRQHGFQGHTPTPTPA